MKGANELWYFIHSVNCNCKPAKLYCVSIKFVITLLMKVKSCKSQLPPFREPSTNKNHLFTIIVMALVI